MVFKEQLKCIKYSEYAFLNLNKEKYEKLFNKIVQKYDDENIENALEQELNKQCKCIFEKDHLLVTNNFINMRFKKGSSYNIHLLNITLLAEFFNKMSFLPNLQFIKDLYKNEKFKKAIEEVINANMQIIKKGKIDEYFDNDILIFIIENHCLINNIEIEETDLKLEKNDVNYNSVKQWLIDINKRPF